MQAVFRNLFDISIDSCQNLILFLMEHEACCKSLRPYKSRACYTFLPKERHYQRISCIARKKICEENAVKNLANIASFNFSMISL